MAYYDKLIADWNNPTQPPPGVIGAPLAGTTAQKIAIVNAWKVAAPAQPMLIPTYRIYNTIVGSEWAALTDIQRTNVRDIFMLGQTDASPNTATRNALMAAFAAGSQTRTNLVNLTKEFDTPGNDDWCWTNHYPTYGQQGPGNLSTSDAANAGLV